jgi:hypothetical protein
MNYLIKYSNFESILEKRISYKEGDIVYIEYWYNKIVTPVNIKEKKGKKFLVSHDVEKSKIQNAPDELIKPSQIISKILN